MPSGSGVKEGKVWDMPWMFPTEMPTSRRLSEFPGSLVGPTLPSPAKDTSSERKREWERSRGVPTQRGSLHRGAGDSSAFRSMAPSFRTAKDAVGLALGVQVTA